MDRRKHLATMLLDKKEVKVFATNHGLERKKERFVDYNKILLAISLHVREALRAINNREIAIGQEFGFLVHFGDLYSIPYSVQENALIIPTKNGDIRVERKVKERSIASLKKRSDDTRLMVVASIRSYKKNKYTLNLVTVVARKDAELKGETRLIPFVEELVS